MSFISAIPVIGTLFGKIFDRIPNSNERARAEEELARSVLANEHQSALAQVETNKTEAAHSSIFVAGWRPGIGWVCVFALATYYIPKHTLAAIFWVKQCWVTQSLVTYPIDEAGLMELTLAMLGFGLMRTTEKLVQRKK